MNQTGERTLNWRLRAAVTSYEGVVVNQHLGMADDLKIFEVDKDGCRLVERRRAPAAGSGEARWQALAQLLSDCGVLLTGGLGEKPLAALSASGLKVFEVEGLIEDALLALFNGQELHMPRRTVKFCRRAGTEAQAGGCC
jgi:nitrogen fixation protein NifB